MRIVRYADSWFLFCVAACAGVSPAIALAQPELRASFELSTFVLAALGVGLVTLRFRQLRNKDFKSSMVNL